MLPLALIRTQQCSASVSVYACTQMCIVSDMDLHTSAKHYLLLKLCVFAPGLAKAAFVRAGVADRVVRLTVRMVLTALRCAAPSVASDCVSSGCRLLPTILDFSPSARSVDTDFEWPPNVAGKFTALSAFWAGMHMQIFIEDL